jgi:hypothetical protein
VILGCRSGAWLVCGLTLWLAPTRERDPSRVVLVRNDNSESEWKREEAVYVAHAPPVQEKLEGLLETWSTHRLRCKHEAAPLPFG